MSTFGKMFSQGADKIHAGMQYAETGGGKYGDITRALFKSANPQGPISPGQGGVNRRSEGMPTDPKGQIDMIIQRLLAGV